MVRAGTYEQVVESDPELGLLLVYGSPVRWLIQDWGLELCLFWAKYQAWVWLVPDGRYPDYAHARYIAFTPNELLMLFGSSRGYDVEDIMDACYQAKQANPKNMLVSIEPIEFEERPC